MKIKEFIEKVNERNGMRAKKVGKEIVIGAPNDMVMIHILEDATNLFEIDTWETGAGLYQYWTKSDREYLSALIEEFLHTPVKERFPEKKWRLYMGRNEYGNDIYLMNVISPYKPIRTCMAAKNEYNTFTDSDLVRLKEQYPRLAPAIDAMKEPVEEE